MRGEERGEEREEVPAVLMIVQPGERNVVDQDMLALRLWQKYRVPTIRRTLAEVSSIPSLPFPHTPLSSSLLLEALPLSLSLSLFSVLFLFLFDKNVCKCVFPSDIHIYCATIPYVLSLLLLYAPMPLISRPPNY